MKNDDAAVRGRADDPHHVRLAQQPPDKAEPEAGVKRRPGEHAPDVDAPSGAAPQPLPLACRQYRYICRYKGNLHRGKGNKAEAVIMSSRRGGRASGIRRTADVLQQMRLLCCRRPLAVQRQPCKGPIKLLRNPCLSPGALHPQHIPVDDGRNHPFCWPFGAASNLPHTGPAATTSCA